MQDDRTNGAPEATQEQRPASPAKQQMLRDNRAHLDQDLVEGQLRMDIEGLTKRLRRWLDETK